MSDRPRVVMMGTPDFAIPTLEALATSTAVELVGVVTQPNRAVGRKRVLTSPPVKEVAAQYSVPVFQPERVRAAQALETLAALQPDVFVTAAYGQILPQRLLDMATHGCLNVHASLLPRWRGAAPIHRALLAGDTVTGVTIMQTVRALDAGPILGTAQRKIALDEDMGRLHDDLAVLGAGLLLDLLPGYLAGDIRPLPQPQAGVTYAERIVRDDEWIDWSKPALEVHNRIRGLSPWPGATTFLGDQSVKIWSSEPPSEAGMYGHDMNLQPTHIAIPGTVTVSKSGEMYVCCGDRWLCLRKIQPAGRRTMSATEWVRGQHDNDGLVFKTVVANR